MFFQKLEDFRFLDAKICHDIKSGRFSLGQIVAAGGNKNANSTTSGNSLESP